MKIENTVFNKKLQKSGLTLSLDESLKYLEMFKANLKKYTLRNRLKK